MRYIVMVLPARLLTHASDLQSNRHLFVPAEKKVPKIRIETRQAEKLMGKRIIVVIDSWPKQSRYPQVNLTKSNSLTLSQCTFK